MDVALDANIFRQDLWLRSPATRALIAYLDRTGSSLLLHAVVEAETEAIFRRQLRADIEKVDSGLSDANRHGIIGLPTIDGEPLVEATLANWRSNFETALGRYIERIDLDNELLPELIRRSVEHLPPCGQTGSEVRDAAIWLGLLNSRAPEKARNPFAFISGNTKEFASPDKQTLVAELEEDVRVLGVNVLYYPSLDAFLHARSEARGFE